MRSSLTHRKLEALKWRLFIVICIYFVDSLLELPFSTLITFSGLSILQGAERKTRDEERRAAKRKMTATGRKKLDELYHPVVDRSEFYSMSDINKPPVLFSPAEDIDKVRGVKWANCIGLKMKNCITNNSE